MKRIVKGKVYDTESAELIGWYNHSPLYRRKKARDYFFAFTREIVPITENEAYKYMYPEEGEFIFDE